MKKIIFTISLIALMLSGCGSTAPSVPFKESFVPKYEESMKTDCLDAINKTIDKIKEYADETDPKKLEKASDAVEPLFNDVEDKFVILIDEYYAADTYAMIDKETYDPLRKEVDEAYNEVYNQYMMVFYEAMHSPLKEYLLSPEDIADLEGWIDNFADDSVKKLKDGITSLEDQLEAATGSQQTSLIAKLVNARNELAKKHGYNNYYEYACVREFHRDYSTDDVEKYRGYIAQYIAPLLNDLYDDVYGDASKYERMGQLFTNTNCFKSSDAMKTIEQYFGVMKSDKYKLDFSTSFDKAREEGRIFTPENGEDGAFTQRRNSDGSYMYFANTTYYSSCCTLAHEFGHYTYSIQPFDGCNSYDLKETHSQTNEKLYQSYYLNNCWSVLYQSDIKNYEKYVAVDDVYSAVLHTMIDEWEMAIYSNYYDAYGFRTGIDPSAYLSSLPKTIAKKYKYNFVINSDNYVYYFNKSSCYEISYAISIIPVLGLYVSIPSIGFENACDRYYRLLAYGNCSDFQQDEKYLNILKYAQYSSPFVESVYEKICEYYD